MVSNVYLSISIVMWSSVQWT